MMRGCADISEREECAGVELALHAGHPMLRVGRDVVRVDGGDTDQRLELRPVDGAVWVRWTCAEADTLQRKTLACVGTCCCHGEWVGEERRRGRGVGVAVRGVGAHNARREAFICGVKHPVAEAHAGLAWIAGEYFERRR